MKGRVIRGIVFAVQKVIAKLLTVIRGSCLALMGIHKDASLSQDFLVFWRVALGLSVLDTLGITRGA